jgi:hypothetical protein
VPRLPDLLHVCMWKGGGQHPSCHVSAIGAKMAMRRLALQSVRCRLALVVGTRKQQLALLSLTRT